MKTSTKMNLPLLWKKRWVRFLVFFGIFTVIALLYTTEVMIMYKNIESFPDIPLTTQLRFELSFWYTWGVLLPVIFWLCRKYRIDSERWGRHATVHIVAGGLVSVAHLIISFSVMWIIRINLIWLDESADSLSWSSFVGRGFGAKNLHMQYLVYWVIIFLHHAIYYYKRSKDNEVRASQLEANLLEAKLEALKMQIHPHFLFNTLHSVSSLMHKDPKAADTMISKLGDFLRMTLDRSEVQEVPLKEELELLERYVEIEEIRFGNRLKVEYRVNPVLLDAYVPNLIFQPLVENAISHGISKKQGGKILISGERDGEYIHFSVIDNGRGVPVSQKFQFGFKQGVGLSNTRKRLEQLYNGNHTLTVISNEESGFSVKLQIPYRTKPYLWNN